MLLNAYKIGMNSEQFYDILPKDFILRQKAFWEAHNEKERTSWEQTRWLASILISPHIKKGRNIKPQDLMRFPWEKQKTKRKDAKQIEKEMAYAEKLYSKIENGKKKN